MEMKEATLALIVQEGKLLLGVKARDAEIGANTLNGPGGKVDQGETSRACVVRETYEEIGVRIHPAEDSLRATIYFHNGTKSTWKVDMYLIESFEGEPTETAAMRPDGDWWYAIDGLTPLYQERMLASDGLWMPKVLNREPYFVAHVHQNDNATRVDRIVFEAA